MFFFLQRIHKCFGTLDFSKAPTITEEEEKKYCLPKEKPGVSVEGQTPRRTVFKPREACDRRRRPESH